jgi:hypothetical protein
MIVFLCSATETAGGGTTEVGATEPAESPESVLLELPTSLSPHAAQAEKNRTQK